MIEKVIQVKNLSYTYPDGTRALQNVSFDVYKGESVGIVGGNGAGKSTLLLHLNGIFPDLKGKKDNNNECIRICGLNMEKGNLKRIRELVGIVFQNPEDQLFSSTLYDDVAFGPRNMGLNNSDVVTVVNEALSKFNLRAHADKNPFHLSFGEKKIAAIATVYSMNPEIYCLDEPTSNLDPAGRRELIEVLKSIEKTKIIVTHDLDFARKICNRVIVLHNGKIEANGEVDKIFSDINLLKKCRLI